MTMEDILTMAVQKKASDIFLIAGQPVSYKINGNIEKQGESPLKPDQLFSMVEHLYEMGNRDRKYGEQGDDDFSVSLACVGRFRVNVFRQRGSWSAVLRVVNFQLQDVSTMGIPKSVLELSERKKGLVLVTGSAGSGKSTTLAYIIDEINKSRNCHILTLEDPIEFLHTHNKSIVSQREIGIDSKDYNRALKAGMRESPDVILIGEMRDLETIEIAMTAAETGHLVLSTLHTVGAANTIDRIIDVFPPQQQQQIRIQLSMVLRSVVSQQLLPTTDGRQVPAFEILKANNAIRTLIRDGKVHQIPSTIATAKEEGMLSMDSSIMELYQSGKIKKETALLYAMNRESMERILS
ncbi:MAG: PilT/PilU family type 4a pilus ATPase [Lachnospiraceae bacterium]|nr:PilT/PilU family type 4a pilus ATPase [Lachnospiraceae bacterium]